MGRKSEGSFRQPNVFTNPAHNSHTDDASSHSDFTIEAQPFQRPVSDKSGIISQHPRLLLHDAGLGSTRPR